MTLKPTGLIQFKNRSVFCASLAARREFDG
jgi:hypothetical protein